MRLLHFVCLVFLLSGSTQIPQAQEIVYDTKAIQSMRCNGAKSNLEHFYAYAPKVLSGVAVESRLVREFFFHESLLRNRVLDLCGTEVAARYRCAFLKTMREEHLRQSQTLVSGLDGENQIISLIRSVLNRANEALLSKQAENRCHRFG